jgi:ABC-type Fe3+ transport system permease subunit
MGEVLPVLAISEQLQANLVIAATFLFLVFATCGLLVSSFGEANSQATPEAEPQASVANPRWRSSMRAAIIAGLLCGLVVLALSGF